MDQQPLFPGQNDKNDKRISIGNGFAIEWVTARMITVYRYGIPCKYVEIKADIDKRRLVVELVVEGGVTKSKIAEALNVSRQSIDNWIDSFKKAGFEGLVNSYKGSRRKGRADNFEKLPIGNKARQLEDERRLEREARHKQQLTIDLLIHKREAEDKIKEIEEFRSNASAEDLNANDKKIDIPDMFKDTYDFRENRHAGSFLYWAIFQHYFNFMEQCGSIYGRYSILIYLFAMMLINKIGSVEQLKTIYKREFGNLIGIKQLFCIPTIWKIIHYVCKLQRSGLLIKGFFKYQAKNGLVSLYWLYIDGHFIPYYGKESVHKGFYTQRDQMMPGQTEMFVNDCHGRIVYFEIQEGKGDLKEMMRRMSNQWSAYMGNTHPLIIADRESWGVEHFLSMKGYRFVTWEKFSTKEELYSISDDDFGTVFYANNKEYQAYEDKKTYSDNRNNSIELRRIVIWNKAAGKRVACVTQDEQEDTTTIAGAMLGRWGCSENAFKHMGERFEMHYNPVIDASDESKNQTIANPEINRLQKIIAQLKKGLSKIERDLGRLPLTTKKDGSLRRSKRREKFQKKQVELKEELTEAEKELKICPARVNLEDVKHGKTFKELDTEGKNLWDLAESLVWNSRKKLIQILKEYLPNQRDLIPVLEAVTKSRGWIKSTKEVIEVRLEPLETGRFKAAQIQLCRALNEKEIRLSNGKRLLYDVGQEPENVQKKCL